MAERRMFAKTIISSDAFLEMPASTQCLYFHLAMRADDEGFINSPKAIMREIGAKDDDAKLLISKKFIIPFDTGIVVIKHWRIHNYIQKDRLTETKYKEERSTLTLDENNAYTQLETPCTHFGYKVDTTCIQNVSKMDTQDRLGKDRLGKDSINKGKNSLVYVPEELKNDFLSYMKMRKSIKKPLTEVTIKMAISKLESLAPGDYETQKNILQQSVFNCWQGLFPISKSKTQNIQNITKKTSFNIDEYEKMTFGKVPTFPEQ